jgi:hypothetical protein
MWPFEQVTSANQRRRVRKKLARILRKPPFWLSEREVTSFLEMLEIRVKPQVGYADLYFPPTGASARILGWKGRLEGQQLERVMDFLRPLTAVIPVIGQMSIPEHRLAQNA